MHIDRKKNDGVLPSDGTNDKDKKDLIALHTPYPLFKQSHFQFTDVQSLLMAENHI